MSTTEAKHRAPRWRRFVKSPFAIASVGSLLLFAAQPPLGWSALAWLAPCPWLFVAMQCANSGRRFYLQVWLAGALYWVLALHWVRLAHPATGIGLLFLAAYLAVYLPLFVWLVRFGSRTCGAPLWFVAPVVWVGCEWLQAHVLGGFLMAALGHTQIDFAMIVQISDLGGAYAVSFLVMTVAASVFECATVRGVGGVRTPYPRAIVATLVFAAASFASGQYGKHRLEQLARPQDAPTRRIALIQGNFQPVWTSDPGRDQRVMDSYLDLTRRALAEARRQGQPVDLVVWPESMFRLPLFSYDEQIESPELAQMTTYAPDYLAAMVEEMQVPLLLGIGRDHLLQLAENDESQHQYEHYNAAVGVGNDGQIIDTYDKTHLVMFGEFVPGDFLWPGIYDWFPIGKVTAGKGPAVFEIEGTRYMPTICYETVLPHAVRGHLAELPAPGQPPDVLVNITNDAWFDDSSELEMHLTCSRFRAIECRTPLVVAANGGLSAHVDLLGNVVAVSQPMTEQWLTVDVQPGAAPSFYARHGDVFALACLIATAGLAIGAVVEKYRRPKSPD